MKEEKPLAYIAGKLNDSACGYIRNLHKMIQSAIKIKRLGYVVYIPGTDILMGLMAGNYVYRDYFDDSQEFLRMSDLVIVLPGWETSEGTNREIKLAHELGIPVEFYNEHTNQVCQDDPYTEGGSNG